MSRSISGPRGAKTREASEATTRAQKAAGPPMPSRGKMNEGAVAAAMRLKALMPRMEPAVAVAISQR